MKVLDACSAPGNKTVHLAALMRGKGKVIACELNEERVKRLKETIRLSGASSILLPILFVYFHFTLLFLVGSSGITEILLLHEISHFYDLSNMKYDTSSCLLLPYQLNII